VKEEKGTRALGAIVRDVADNEGLQLGGRRGDLEDDSTKILLGPKKGKREVATIISPVRNAFLL